MVAGFISRIMNGLEGFTALIFTIGSFLLRTDNNEVLSLISGDIVIYTFPYSKVFYTSIVYYGI